ncbi:hypothetical protein [Cryptosporangium japonicum]|uniref:hypothetical protein n=1 Tax=Cryptosporangium japonicum TaxID=80872 RepID=UPI0031E24A54
MTSQDAAAALKLLVLAIGQTGGRPYRAAFEAVARGALLDSARRRRAADDVAADVARALEHRQLEVEHAVGVLATMAVEAIEADRHTWQEFSAVLRRLEQLTRA